MSDTIKINRTVAENAASELRRIWEEIISNAENIDETYAPRKPMSATMLNFCIEELERALEQ